MYRLGLRGFHAGSAAAFKQKAKEQTAKMRTPKKGSGEYRNFRRAAAYSKFSKSATEVPVGSENLRIFAAPDLEAPVTEPSMVVFPDAVQSSLVHMADFQPQQNNELFLQRASLLRSESSQIQNIIKQASSKEQRVVLTGPAGSGKSTLLAQAHALAKLQNWIVLHIPRAEDLIDGSTDAIASKSGSGFDQPMLSRRWAQRIAKANRDVLTSDDLKLLTSASAKEDPAGSLNTFISQLESGGRPVLISADSFNAFVKTPFSANRTKENEPIYHGDLQVPQILLDFLSNKRTLKNGAVIVATSGRIITNDTIAIGLGHGQAPAYATPEEFDGELASRLQGVREIAVGSFSPVETDVYMRYIAAAGLAEYSPELVAAKYAVSGNGNPRALLRSCVSFAL